MNCGDVHEKDLVERYVAGTLSEEVRSEFEVHFLGCERCAKDVEATLAIRDALPTVAVKRRILPLWAAAAASIMVVLVGGFWQLRERRQSPTIVERPLPTPAPPAPAPSAPDQRLLELARIVPPAYEDTVLRSTGDQAFRAAMRHYVERRYPEAIEGLEKAAAVDPTASHVKFFLGASYLLDERTGAAIETLRAVAGDRESPFAEEAKFYLAKALIRAGRLEEARAELKALVAAGGPWAEEARELLAQLG